MLPGAQGVEPVRVQAKSFRAMDRGTKRDYIQRVCRNLREGVPYSTACWCEGIDPDELSEDQVDNPNTRSAVKQATAQGNRMLQQAVLAGDLKTLSPARAALECLTRTNEGWGASKPGLTTKQFEEAVDLLKRKLDPDTLGIVLSVFAQVR